MSYFNIALDGRREAVVSRAVRVLAQHSGDFDSIVATGMSGMSVAPIVAFVLKKQLVVVRKTTDGTHSCDLVEKDHKKGIRRYVIIDDFVSSGDTVNRVYRQLAKHRGAQPVAIYCYAAQEWNGLRGESRTLLNETVNDSVTVPFWHFDGFIGDQVFEVQFYTAFPDAR
jgi:adenine/guanine phosphoribosyltransferase-like PRPP-binding protein